MSEQRPDRPGPKRGPGMNNGGMKFSRGLFGWVLFIAIAALLFMLVKSKTTNYTTIPWSNFLQEVENQQVQKLVIEGPEITGGFRAATIVNGQKVNNFRTIIPDGWNDFQFGRWLYEKAG